MLNTKRKDDQFEDPKLRKAAPLQGSGGQQQRSDPDQSVKESDFQPECSQAHCGVPAGPDGRVHTADCRWLRQYGEVLVSPAVAARDQLPQPASRGVCPTIRLSSPQGGRPPTLSHRAGSRNQK